METIRLGCRLCDRNDFDFVAALPLDWFDIEETQSLEASLQKAQPECPEVSVFAWYTHLGVCPSCYEAEIHPPLPSSR